MVCFFHLMLAGRQPFGVLRWNSCFVSFIWCQLFACLIRAANFRLPPAFVVWSFFLCHRHLWSVLSFFATGICVQSLYFTAFSAIGIHVRLFVSALLALVSGYRGISQFLVSCCALAARQLHPWRFEWNFFQSRLPCGQLYKFRFEANPIWYSAMKLRNRTQRNARYTYGRDWGAASKSARLNCTNLTHFRLTAGRFRRNSCIVILWVACELLHFAATQ